MDTPQGMASKQSWWMGAVCVANLTEIYSEALAAYNAKDYDKALAMADDFLASGIVYSRFLLLKAYIFRDTGRYVQEMEILQELLRIEEQLGNREKDILATAWSLLGAVCVMLGETEAAVDYILLSADYEQDFATKCNEYSNAIFAANYCENFSAGRWQELYAGYRALLKDIEPVGLRHNGDYGHEKLRIGYLSADFVCHPVAYFIRPLLEFCDREKFSIYLYNAGVTEDDISEHIFGWVDEVRRISKLSYQEAAEMIAADEIDVLVDLSGHTRNNRLPILAYRPAPKILSGIGYFNSLGMDIDGFLSDRYCCYGAEKDVNAYRHAEFFEPLLMLPKTHFCYSMWKPYPRPADEPPCAKNGYITFGCFNNFSKVTDAMLELWRDILQRVPNSRLLLKHKLFDSAEGREWTMKRLHRLEFPVERVDFQGFSEEYLKCYRQVDIALDTFPYAGGLTTVEALMMGVPVVTKYGNRHGTRFGLSFLSNLGLTELAAADDAGYMERVVMLAQNMDVLTFLHKNLRRMLQTSPLMDGYSYCRDVEKVYMM